MAGAHAAEFDAFTSALVGSQPNFLLATGFVINSLSTENPSISRSIGKEQTWQDAYFQSLWRLFLVSRLAWRPLAKSSRRRG